MSDVESESEPQGEAESLEIESVSPRPRRVWGRLLFLLITLVLTGTAALAFYEMETSHFQAKFFSELTEGADWKVEAGPASNIRFPVHGPYDMRLGFTRIPAVTGELEAKGYGLTHQANWSPKLIDLVDRGAFVPYREKSQAGLSIVDATGNPLHMFARPREVYQSLENVPPVMLDSLLFVENRALLDAEPRTRNPAVEWSRLGNAVVENGLQYFGFGGARPSGGSTLATQIEKYRHSPEGRTHSLEDKLQQMVSASLRAYLDGPDTTAARGHVALDYLNSVPLSANPKTGEVFGMRDALQVWFDVDVERVDELLLGVEEDEVAEIEDRGLEFRRVLSLILAQRRPSELLLQRRDALDEITDSHLRVMKAEGVIPPELADAALATRSLAVDLGDLPDVPNFASQKTQSAVRGQIRELVGESSLHTLDRMDVEVQSTLELGTQLAIRDRLLALRDPEVAKAMGFIGPRMLKTDATGIVFGLTLYERTPYGSALRLQVDTFEQPLNINDGIKLDLGSTAKLRTTATYLEIITDLHASLSKMTAEERKALVVAPDDVLTQWVAGELRKRPDVDLPALLEAAMLRTYSASPAETFYTGGGVHRFGNFDKADNGRRVTAREALRKSINLPFVRMMREIVRYYIPRLENAGPTLFTDPTHPGRMPRLEGFADVEAREFLRRFWTSYKGLDDEQAVQKLISRRKKWTPVSLATALRSAAPEVEFEAFESLMRGNLDAKKIDDEKMRKLYDAHGPGKFDWNDRGYLTRIHPLELWMIQFFREEPGASWERAVEASTTTRREVYKWLLKSNRIKAQNKRLRIVLEREAFKYVHAQWKSLGYPFDEVTPSLASSIGAAADRPDALARLVGVIAGGGLLLPRYVATTLHFAADTPYETRFERLPVTPLRVMDAAVADRLKDELIGVVRHGTAKRLVGAEPYASDPMWVVGGKTGTGDHRRKKIDARGKVLEEVPVSRSATFVFLLGDRFHGTLTAYVEGEAAAQHSFTSSLPVSILRMLAPELETLVGRSPVPSPAEALTEPVKKPNKPKKRAAPASTIDLFAGDKPAVDGVRKHQFEFDTVETLPLFDEPPAD